MTAFLTARNFDSTLPDTAPSKVSFWKPSFSFLKKKTVNDNQPPAGHIFLDLGSPESKADKRKAFFENLKNNAPAISKGIAGGLIGNYILKSAGLGALSSLAMVYAKPLYVNFNKSASVSENIQNLTQVFQDKDRNKSALKTAAVSLATLGLIDNVDTLKDIVSFITPDSLKEPAIALTNSVKSVATSLASLAMDGLLGEKALAQQTMTFDEMQNAFGPQGLEFAALDPSVIGSNAPPINNGYDVDVIKRGELPTTNGYDVDVIKRDELPTTNGYDVDVIKRDELPTADEYTIPESGEVINLDNIFSEQQNTTPSNNPSMKPWPVEVIKTDPLPSSTASTPNVEMIGNGAEASSEITSDGGLDIQAVYEIKRGDTLGQIILDTYPNIKSVHSPEFNIALKLMKEANCIDNVNLIYAGDDLKIPVYSSNKGILAITEPSSCNVPVFKP